MLWTGSAFTLYLDDSCTGPCGSHSDAVAVWSCVRGRATLWPACPLSSLSSSLRASWRLSRSTCAPCTLRVCAVRGVSTRRSFRSSLRPRLCPPWWSRTWRLRFVSVPACLPESYLSFSNIWFAGDSFVAGLLLSVQLRPSASVIAGLSSRRSKMGRLYHPLLRVTDIFR